MYKVNIGLKGDGIFDLPFIGNLGKEGKNALINKIKEYKDTYVLIHTAKECWQESDEFRNYIKDNYEYIENICDFSVYYIKE